MILCFWKCRMKFVFFQVDMKTWQRIIMRANRYASKNKKSRQKAFGWIFLEEISSRLKKFLTWKRKRSINDTRALKEAWLPKSKFFVLRAQNEALIFFPKERKKSLTKKSDSGKLTKPLLHENWKVRIKWGCGVSKEISSSWKKVLDKEIWMRHKRFSRSWKAQVCSLTSK